MKFSEEVNISLEVILLLAGGLIMLVLSAVLFSVAGGALPYYKDGVYGLLLVIYGLQLQTVGKNPIRYVKRSWSALIPGIIITSIGFVTCFVPGLLGDVPRILVIIIFGVGSIVLFLQLFISKEMYLSWKTPGCAIYTNLTLSCAAVYILGILIAVLIAIRMYQPGLLSTGLLAGVALLFGIVLFYLAFVLQNVYQLRQESEISTNTSCISLDTLMGMQYGVFMVVSGCLLVPVYLGLLPFATSAQLGTLLVLLGVQALVVGNMMTLTFKRNGMILLVGGVFVMVGAFAVVVPDLLVMPLAIFIALFNITGGLYLLYTLIHNLIRSKPASEVHAKKPEGNDLRLLILLLALAVLTAILMIIIGVVMLFDNLIPGMTLAFFLICFGLTLFALFNVQSRARRKHLV
ncbi:MAG: hypothetical protein PHF57_14220 [Methanoregula sp.]|nr:hypothetical protein [Methanoregula sp.]